MPTERPVRLAAAVFGVIGGLCFLALGIGGVMMVAPPPSGVLWVGLGLALTVAAAVVLRAG